MAPQYHFTYQGKLFEPCIKQKKDEIGKDKIWCIKRRKWLCYGPEEFVRQELLHFLLSIQDCQDYPIHVLAERNGNLDIAIYAKSPFEDFFPDVSPVLIIEVKEDRVVLGKAQEDQLSRYLRLRECAAGILTNGRFMTYYGGEYPFRSQQFATLDEVETLIRKRVETITQAWKRDKPRFDAAQNGCYASFKYLVETYNKQTRFQLAIKDNYSKWTGYSFSVSNGEFQFRPDGVTRRKTFDQRDFQRLVRIKPAYDWFED
jgi:hypothetical protein